MLSLASSQLFLIDLSKRQVKAFTDDQLAALSGKQIRKADDFIDVLSAKQLDALPFKPNSSSRLDRLVDPSTDLGNLLTPDPDPLA